VHTLLIPTVQTQEEAEQAVAYTRYPPRGVRGFASGSRSSRFGRIDDYHNRCEEEICVLVQIETNEGLENLDAICRVEGVDGVFIGPGDLSAGLGYLGQPGHPEVRKVIEDAIRRIRAAGNAPGVLTGDDEQIRAYMEAGCQFVAVGADAALLARGSEALARKYKK
jgi:4-hydroxy-2-oxoheptanedioate aldolase